MKGKAAALKLTGYNSCIGCQFLYTADHEFDEKYPARTALSVHCALDKNPSIPNKGVWVPRGVWSNEHFAAWEPLQHMCERYLRIPTEEIQPADLALTFNEHVNAFKAFLGPLHIPSGYHGMAKRAIKTHVRKEES